METIQSLIGVLKQQIELYQSIYELLKEEKGYISKWQIDKTLETVKKKETLLYKEKILDESRDRIAKNIQKKLNLKNASLSELVNAIDDPYLKEELISLRKEILDITNQIYSENMAIKILYHTNLQLIRDFFEQIGMISSSSYDSFGATQTKPKGVVRTA